MKKYMFFIGIVLFFLLRVMTKGYCQDLSTLEGIAESVFKQKLAFSVYDDKKTPEHVKKIISLTSTAYQKFDGKIGHQYAEEVKMQLWQDLASDKKIGIRSEYSDQVYRLWLYSIVEYLAGYGIYAEIGGVEVENNEVLPWMTFYQVVRLDPHHVEIWDKKYDIDVVVVTPELKIDGQIIHQAKTDQMQTLAITTSDCIIIRENILLDSMSGNQAEKQRVGYLPAQERDKLYSIAPFQDLEKMIQGVIFINSDPAKLYEETIWHESGHLKDFRDPDMMKIMDEMDLLSRNTHAEIDAFLTELRYTPYSWYALQVMTYCLSHKDHNSPHCYAMNYIFDGIADIVMSDPDQFGYRKLRPDVNPRWQLMYQLPEILKSEKHKRHIFDTLYEKHRTKDMSLVFTPKWLDRIYAKSYPIQQDLTINIIFHITFIIVITFYLIVAVICLRSLSKNVSKKSRQKMQKWICILEIVCKIYWINVLLAIYMTYCGHWIWAVSLIAVIGLNYVTKFRINKPKNGRRGK